MFKSPVYIPPQDKKRQINSLEENSVIIPSSCTENLVYNIPMKQGVRWNITNYAREPYIYDTEA
jgi:hypothetical protein